MSVGIMLSGSVSVKFVGLFVVTLVGIRTIVDLWEILGDLSRPVVLYILEPYCRKYIVIIFLDFNPTRATR